MKSFARLFKGGGFLRRSLEPLTAVSGTLYRSQSAGKFENPRRGFSSAKHLQRMNKHFADVAHKLQSNRKNADTLSSLCFA